jgi:hypothetical protein
MNTVARLPVDVRFIRLAINVWERQFNTRTTHGTILDPALGRMSQ